MFIGAPPSRKTAPQTRFEQTRPEFKLDTRKFRTDVTVKHLVTRAGAAQEQNIQKSGPWALLFDVPIPDAPGYNMGTKRASTPSNQTGEANRDNTGDVIETA